MGLDFSHCNAHWAYSGFNRFRTNLAYEIGIDLESMQGFGGSQSWNGRKDPITHLLHHSDCEGTITPNMCGKIAPRLRELVKDWPDAHDKQQALLLAEGMELANERNERLEFT